MILELILFIEEARLYKDTEHDINEILEDAPSTKYNPIMSNEKCRRYKIPFEDYLIYSVPDESFGV